MPKRGDWNSTITIATSGHRLMTAAKTAARIGLNSDDGHSGGDGSRGGNRGGWDRGDDGHSSENDRDRPSTSHNSGRLAVTTSPHRPPRNRPPPDRPYPRGNRRSPSRRQSRLRPTAPPADEAGGGSSTGVQGDAAPNTAPPVTVGNGRSPGLSWERPDEPNIVLDSVPPPVSSALAPPPPPPPVLRWRCRYPARRRRVRGSSLGSGSPCDRPSGWPAVRDRGPGDHAAGRHVAGLPPSPRGQGRGRTHRSLRPATLRC